MILRPSHHGPSWYPTDTVAVWQPKGAASLEASYVDASGHGNTMAVRSGLSAPSLVADGWQFAGAHGLTTGIVQPSAEWSMVFVGYVTSIAAYQCLIGAIDTTPAVARSIGIYVANGGQGYASNGGTAIPASGSLWTVSVKRIVVVSGKSVYLNGTLVSTIDPGTVLASGRIGVGYLEYNSTVNVSYRGYCIVSAVALIPRTLTTGEVASVSAAAAAL